MRNSLRHGREKNEDEEYYASLDWLERYMEDDLEDPEIIRSINLASEYRKLLIRKDICGDFDDHRFVRPQVTPTSAQRYLTRFVPKLDDGDKKASYWMEKEAKAIRDPSDSRNIIGLKRTLEYMNGNKRRHRWFADEYVALERWGRGAVRILEDIAVRKVYEEGKETAPPSKCSKTCAHSSGESYSWQHMTRVYVTGEAGPTAAPSLLYGICHECDKALKCPPNFGNGNLNKHLARVHDIHPPCKNQCVMTEEKGVGRRAVRV